jgi:acyl-CoA reductase-like NAD-dependent aldehyde dehydrogenase
MFKVGRALPTAFNYVHGARCVPKHATNTFAIMEPAKGERFSQNSLFKNNCAGKRLHECPVSSTADVDAAVQSARTAFVCWSNEPYSTRARVLRTTADLIRVRVHTHVQ